jgi:gluconokinase
MTMAAERPTFGLVAIVVMGVAGSGKTTVGAQLAASLGVPFLEGDAYHPASNIEKMSAGVPLQDNDRWPWLQTLGAALGSSARQHGCAILACSALKRSYRDYLRKTVAIPLQFVFLRVDPKLVQERVSGRLGHFMPETLLESQFATLEVPDESEAVLSLDSSEPVSSLIAAVRAALSKRSA